MSDVDAAVAALSASIRELTAAGDRRGAAMACVELGSLFGSFMGNMTAARAWYARAFRLIADEEPCVEQGWVAIAPMGCEVDDPAVLLERAELALDRARRFGDVNLETKALADAGLAHVQAGRMAEGMALLDEAMALACGPADDTSTAARSVCSFFTACYYTADYDRAGRWAETLRHHGLIGLTPGPTLFLSDHCDSVQASLLCELGRWGDADALLTNAVTTFEAGMPFPSWHSAIALADLRVRQGRLADAEALLIGKEAVVQALLPAARLHLARNDLELARAAAARGLRAMRDDRLRAAEMLVILIEVELRAGAVDAAVAACADLDARVQGLGCPALEARVAAARARVLAATGDTATAIAAVEAAADRLPANGAHWLRATLRIELARLHERAGDSAAATVEAKAAAAILADLDVVLPAEDDALLHRLGAPTGAAADTTATLRGDGKWWTVSCGDTQGRLPDTKGLRYLAQLVATPGVERHALDLVDRVEGAAPSGLDRRRLGDAGELLDSRARSEYRRRIEALRAEIDEELDAGREERAEALQAELDQLVGQLAAAFGLGGRARRASSAAERARLNVTRAVRAAIAKVTECLPGPGAALDRHVRTGVYCAYEPADGDLRWIVQS